MVESVQGLTEEESPRFEASTLGCASTEVLPAQLTCWVCCVNNGVGHAVLLDQDIWE